MIRKSTAGPAQRKGRPQDDRIADGLCCGKTFLNTPGNGRWDDRLVQFLAQLLKFLAVLRTADALRVRPQKLDLALIENALLVELQGEIEPGLTADSRNDRVRPLIAAYPGHILQRKRLHIYFVSDRVISHNGRRVGIGKNDLIAFLLEGKAGLGSRVIELGSLADHDRSRADNKNLMNICPFWHSSASFRQ